MNSNSSGKCLIIDNQNCDQNELQKIKLRFKRANLESEIHENLTTRRMERLIKDENCLVVCIFAAFSTETPSKKAFLCENNSPFCVQELAKIFARKRAPTYVLINDYNLNQNSNGHNQFHLLYQTSSVYISFNTYDWLHIERLCTRLCSHDVSQCNTGQCQVLQQLGNDVSNLIEHSYDHEYFRQFTENIFKISTNAAELAAHSMSPEKSIDSAYDYCHPSNGMCLILNFDKEETDFPRRGGTSGDEKMLAETFQLLGFKVNLIDTVDLKEIIEIVSSFDHSTSNCLVICIIAPFRKAEECLQNLLAAWLNPTLETKPKIVLIHNPYKSEQNKDLFNSINALSNLSWIPKHFLIVYSSFVNDCPDSNDFSGVSHFIQMLNKIVKNCLNKYDLFMLLQMAIFAIQKHSITIKRNCEPSVLVKSTLENLFFIESNPSISYPIAESLTFDMISPILNYKKLSRENISALFYQYTRGRCLLINYPNMDKPKIIVARDKIDSLKNTFEKLNFEVDVINGGRFKSWEIFRNEYKKNYDNCNCLVVIILPNGNPKAIIDRDTLFNFFTDKSLIEKPKLFFVLDSSEMFTESVETDRIGDKSEMIRIPKYANFLYFYCDKVTSVDILCNELLNKSSNFDINSTLSNVFKKLRQSDGKNRVCYLNSTLTQLLSFKELFSFPQKITKLVKNLKGKGICHIFSVREIKDSNGNVINDRTRQGNEYDVANLKKFFGKKLNFDIKLYHNLDSKEQIAQLDKIHQEDYSSYGCFVMCHLSHGSYYGHLECSQGAINRDDLIRSVSTNSSLNDKPKIFLIQACQGGLKYEDTINDVEIDYDETPFGTNSWNYPDIFVFTGSYPGYISIRNAMKGSYFINFLCNILTKYYAEYDLATMAAMVSNKIGYFVKLKVKIEVNSETRLINFRQIPFLHSTMTEPIVLARYKL